MTQKSNACSTLTSLLSLSYNCIIGRQSYANKNGLKIIGTTGEGGQFKLESGGQFDRNLQAIPLFYFFINIRLYWILLFTACII